MDDTTDEAFPAAHPNDLSQDVAARERRKVQARQESDRTIWTGVGTFGAIGWSIAIPTLAGVALGTWLDRNHPGRSSWTLSLLLAGVTLGCLSAWRWIRNEHRVLDRKREGQEQ